MHGGEDYNQKRCEQLWIDSMRQRIGKGAGGNGINGDWRGKSQEQGSPAGKVAERRVYQSGKLAVLPAGYGNNLGESRIGSGSGQGQKGANGPCQEELLRGQILRHKARAQKHARANHVGDYHPHTGEQSQPMISHETDPLESTSQNGWKWPLREPVPRKDPHKGNRKLATMEQK